ncbi:MAG: hypothetical protein ABIV51_03715, partial [Saprospiraceae bacterium]
SGGFSTFNNPMLNENIAQVLRWYKGRCTFEIRKFEPDFAWQSRYYDIIIQNEESFHQVQSYIEDNPNNWNEDEFYY